MKLMMSAAVLAVVASSVPALAGNIAPPVAPSLTTNWSGWYGGVSLGYGAGRYDQGVSAASGSGPTVVGGIYNSSQRGVSETNYGLTIGAGVEHMIRPNMSIFGEANYVDPGTLKFGDNNGPLNYDGKGDFATMKFGVNFHF